MSTTGKLAGKRALVTGSGTGIGREIALEFARQGADVVLHYAAQRQGCGVGRRGDPGAGPPGRSVPGRLRQRATQVQSLASRAIEFLGGVDCLVNNSGITFNKPFLQVTPEQFDVLVPRERACAVLPDAERRAGHAQHGGGTICNLTSIHGLQGAPEHSVYAGTKGAIIAQTRTLGVELAHKGIRLNAIAPGWVTVENYYKAIPGFNEEGARESAKNAVPVGHAGMPLDIARLAVFLCSDDAEFIIGQTHRRRRRHHRADVADLRFPQRVGQPVWHGTTCRAS